MPAEKKAYRISGHETFSFRYTWLPKAVRALASDPFLFSNEENAMVALGVGKNMVRSIRFWSQAASIIRAAPMDGNPPGPPAPARRESAPRGRFGIVLPKSRQVALFGKHRLWEKRSDAEFHLFHSRGYAPPGSELHSAYVGEIDRDFWLNDGNGTAPP